MPYYVDIFIVLNHFYKTFKLFVDRIIQFYRRRWEKLQISFFAYISFFFERTFHLDEVISRCNNTYRFFIDFIIFSIGSENIVFKFIHNQRHNRLDCFSLFLFHGHLPCHINLSFLFKLSFYCTWFCHISSISCQ